MIDKDLAMLMRLELERIRSGLTDMIESGRLTGADTPDDFRWLSERLESVRGLLDASERVLKGDAREPKKIFCKVSFVHEHGRLDRALSFFVSPGDGGNRAMTRAAAWAGCQIMDSWKDQDNPARDLQRIEVAVGDENARPDVVWDRELSAGLKAVGQS